MDIQSELQKGTLYHQSGKLDSAAQVYDSILANMPGQPNALHLRALIEQQKNKPESAIAMLQTAIRNSPYSALMHYDLGVVYRDTKQFDDALRCFQTALQLQPDLAIARQMLGKTLFDAERFEETSRFCAQMTIQKPEDYCFLFLLGASRSRLQQFEEAETTLCELSRLQADYPNLQNELGTLYWKQKKLFRAAKAFELAVYLNQQDTVGWSNLGAVLHEMKDTEGAKIALQKAIEQSPNNAGAHYNLANLLKDGGQLKDAARHYCIAIKLNPQHVDFRINYVTLLNMLGQFEESAYQCREILKIDPHHAKAYYSLFTFNSESVSDEEVSKLNELLAKSQIPQAEMQQAYYSLGKRFDKIGQYDKAFGCFQNANRLDDRHDQFDEQVLVGITDSIIEIFNSASQKFSQLKGSDSCQPIFVLGMPRSGSTLVDQILTSHSQISGAGEFTGIRKLIENELAATEKLEENYPESLLNLTSSKISEMSQAYLKLLVETAGEANRITDKMPTNSFHIGLISLLFPHATIIYTARNALDICLSCYFQNFTTQHNFSFNLRNTAIFYREHSRLMAFWQEKFPGKIQTIEYEKLVENQEAETRRLIEEICGLQWEDDCLNFHQNQRAVNTASLWQVRQPMYQKSVSRWKNYTNHVEPLFEVLGQQDFFAA